MVRLVQVGAVVAMLMLSSCASDNTSGSATSSIDKVPPTTVPATTSSSTTSSATTTIVTTTTATSTTTTTTVPVDPMDAATWIGHHFIVEDESGSVLTRDYVLFAGCGDVILIGGDDAGVYPWFVGFANQPDVLIVGSDPIECPPEDAEPPESGPWPVLPVDPGSDTPYRLTVWALAPSADVGNGYRITDAIEVEFPQSVLATLGFMSIEYDSWWCELDASLEPEELFGFFEESDSLKIATHYPAVFAFRVQDSSLDVVPPDMVSCIVRKGPDYVP